VKRALSLPSALLISLWVRTVKIEHKDKKQVAVEDLPLFSGEK